MDKRHLLALREAQLPGREVNPDGFDPRAELKKKRLAQRVRRKPTPAELETQRCSPKWWRQRVRARFAALSDQLDELYDDEIIDDAAFADLTKQLRRAKRRHMKACKAMTGETQEHDLSQYWPDMPKK